MLYNEFLQGTGCKDTENNFKVYRHLEAIYNNDDRLTKEDIYKAGKSLVDNSETEAEKIFREETEKKIKIEEEDITYYTGRIETLSLFCNECGLLPEEYKAYREDIKRYKGIIKQSKANIKRYRWVLGL